MLSVIYFVAFLSLAVQITGLAGPNGILPFNEFLDFALQQRGNEAYFYLPTVFWINSGNTALQLVAYTGCVLSIALFLGYQKKKVLILLFIFYLSLFHAGQMFLRFQWDSLLLEAGFLAIFLTAGPSHLIIFLYHWLLFRLRFMSGMSKLLSDDPSWANLTTLNYYFETQPLPPCWRMVFPSTSRMGITGRCNFCIFYRASGSVLYFSSAQISNFCGVCNHSHATIDYCYK